MPTIHPAPKLVTFRDDGDGGLQVTVTTSSGGFEVLDVTPERAAHYLAMLAGFVERRFRAREGLRT